MELTKVYTLKRSAMGRQPRFSQQGPEMCDSMYTNKEDAKDYILRNPVHTGTQNTAKFAQCEINTIRAEFVHTGALHCEGGWPRDVNVHDPEATQRYRRKLEKEDGYIRFVMNLAPSMEHYVLQNNAIELYQTYYTELRQFPKLENCDCRIVNIFRNFPLGSPHRPVSSICWQPDGGHRFAVTYLEVDFNRNTRVSVDAHIWDVDRPNTPESTITPPCPMLDLQYNPKDVNMLAGALINGQVGAWDKRAQWGPALLCPLHVAHRDIVRNVHFISSKSGMEFFSGGADGAVKWWDIRNMSKPTDELILDVVKSNTQEPSMATANGISHLEYEHTIPTRFMVGTENGLILSCNRKGKTHMDKIPGRFEAHLGPVRACERNPGFLKNFLTVGDWTARIWSEDCRESAILWSPPHRHRVTDGTWSPTRFSLLVLTKWNGVVAVWDLLRRQHEPIVTMQLCDEALLRVRAHENGSLVACGSENGHVYMLELSRNLIAADKNDKVNLTSVLEREYKRERILETRLREIRLKHRQVEEGSPSRSMMDLDATGGDKDLHTAAADYFAQVKKEQASF